MTANTQLKTLLDKFKDKNVLIVGDVMVDEYLWGKVSRISPEAPVPVVSCTSREHRMGGAANVAINIRALGANPIMCSVIGEDETGRIYQNLLEKNAMTNEGILKTVSRSTTVKTRVIGNHQHLLRVDQEITSFIDSELEKTLTGRIGEIIQNTPIHAVIMQDYDKGVLTQHIINHVTRLSGDRNIPVLVDPKKRNFLNYKSVSLFKPNFKELSEGLNISVVKDDAEALFSAARILHTQYDIANVMITLSEKGVFVSNGKEYKIIPAEERDIADVSGAGDTVISVAALCMASGLDVFRTAEIANLAGGLVCEKIGVVPITAHLLLGE